MEKIVIVMLLFTGFVYLYNKIQKIVKIKKNNALLKNARLKQKQVYLKSTYNYGAINNFTICLSIDYRVKTNFSKENKAVVNKAIYSKMTEILTSKIENIEVKNLCDALIIMSADFNSYDKIYDSVLKILSKIKPEIDSKYDVFMIPSITVDAYTLKPDMERIKNDHMNIKNCNLVGASCTSETFNKKYTYLNKNKYAGTPIGEYYVSDKEKENTYKLNLVNKNIASQLESI